MYNTGKQNIQIDFRSNDEPFNWTLICLLSIEFIDNMAQMIITILFLFIYNMLMKITQFIYIFPLYDKIFFIFFWIQR